MTHQVTPQAGVDSEVGRLRTVMLHRPGPELQRLTPRNNDRLLFDGIPWVTRAQEEHDAFAEALRDRDVEVLYLTELLTQTLADAEARTVAVETALTGSGGLDLGTPSAAGCTRSSTTPPPRSSRST
ncbi:arginine deiminase family protein [Nocardioides sambongensis]|uniref:arginine deiminase family protein n=1 Tax=Nocardioides sambongensis TaxID=2589074 RepID=UPI0022ABA46A|nr:arginine deiminase family protein [Nocardioides sambongensis]